MKEALCLRDSTKKRYEGRHHGHRRPGISTGTRGRGQPWQQRERRNIDENNDRERESNGQRNSNSGEIEHLRRELDSIKMQLINSRKDGQMKQRVNIVLRKRDLCPCCRRRLQHKFFEKFTESQWTGKNY